LMSRSVMFMSPRDLPIYSANLYFSPHAVKSRFQEEIGDRFGNVCGIKCSWNRLLNSYDFIIPQSPCPPHPDPLPPGEREDESVTLSVNSRRRQYFGRRSQVDWECV
jgi:hypothetical protein